MKLLHIITGLNVGGAELMLKRLIGSHQNNADYRHSVISLTLTGKVGIQLQEIGIEVRALGMRSPLDIPRVLWQLVRIIRTERPNIVQTWLYHADLLGGLAARLAGNHNVVWDIHTTDVQACGTRATLVVMKMCAWLSGLLPHTIVCVAEASRRAHIAVGYDATRMKVVANGFDLSRLVATTDQQNMLRRQCGFSEQEIVIGTLGRFNPAKDYENFVHMAGLLAEQCVHVRFLMVGSGLDSDNTELAGWIARTGHADSFVLLAERDDVPVCLAAMDIFCLSSRTEAFPTVVGEAMAMGLPCVVTDVGDTAMLVADTGIVVPKENSNALAQGLKKLLEMTPDAHQQMGQKARERIHAEFTMERARERFEAVYESIFNDNRM